ncbi:uncharacterized protein C8Q71DRAFT_853748 [Rhodofomes roseus]|uniref:Cep57 centrosome microtubule-binding domain-containing protein n=1 Tax=Rhodofomes roseus TaxID=34475 RepID=A0ABQ8KRC6_9APHY|nr:uncharacterized protein C8Q71DRAFT_853748 [Rhodofomes roseus]KAH9841344.1 hypothetical protein C8Q71DRAFT_853748 [Rhodofomes roseus]
MSRRSSTYELSIRGDELEQDRIQLEHNLQHTDLSLHLSSTPADDYSDVEYPRHNSAPSPFSGFASFEQHSPDGFDPVEHSQYNAWSIRSFNDDNTVNPYGGETMSTAAHHASALTFSAGLGGRATRRADVSLSGAEYDPERPLHGIMASMNGHPGSFQVDTIKSKAPMSFSAQFDPLVVEDTEELDRVLQSGHATLPVPSLQSSTTSSASASDPDSPRPQSPSVRPKLSDALDAITFSPKRPRSAQSQLPRVSGRSSSFSAMRLQEAARQPSPPIADRDLPPSSRARRPTQSPRYEQHHQQSLSYAQPDPEVKVHPATPSSVNSSKFTKLARGLAQEIEAEQGQRNSARQGRGPNGAPIAQSTVRGPRVALIAKERNPFKDVANQVPASALKFAKPKTPFKNRVHLPDVTGLTSAVLSPARARLDYQRYDRKEDGEVEARLFATLNAVQSKLAFLEGENSASRRRVHELELELEACKQEVARERTKVEEREGLVAQHAAVVLERERERLANLDRQAKAKARAQRRDVEVDAGQRSINESKYKEAVEEKKALEALISTLRNHLARLTSELSDHQRLLAELRSLRDSDVKALAQKGKDIDSLRHEVERLAGEVEVLKGVIEEGLRERRHAREVSARNDMENTIDEKTEDVTDSEEDGDMPNRSVHQVQVLESSEFSESEDEDEAESHVSTAAGRGSPAQPSVQPVGIADKTLRTDHATVGSSIQADDLTARPFVDVDEVDRISTDLQDRRSERSTSMAAYRSVNQSFLDSRVLSRSISPTASLRSSRTSSIASTSRQSSPVDDEEEPAVPTSSRGPPTTAADTRQRLPSPVPEPPAIRPSVPTPAHALRQVRMKQPEMASHSQRQPEVPPETPFPNIRGERLERLFFSAPEHNAQTCTVCHRRMKRQGSKTAVDDHRPFWSVGPGTGRERPEDDDEGFAEGSDEDVRPGFTREEKGKEREADKLPPQTVLSRVIRELEDDFTHFKSVYVELADQYKLMDAASNVAKRNVVAGHLREVIDILEQKVR